MRGESNVGELIPSRFQHAQRKERYMKYADEQTRDKGHRKKYEDTKAGEHGQGARWAKCDAVNVSRSRQKSGSMHATTFSGRCLSAALAECHAGCAPRRCGRENFVGMWSLSLPKEVNSVAGVHFQSFYRKHLRNCDNQ